MKKLPENSEKVILFIFLIFIAICLWCIACNMIDCANYLHDIKDLLYELSERNLDITIYNK